MATTTNYGWTTPDDTALVKDGASAIRTLGSSVDTTTKNLNPETTLGDLAYRSSTSNVNTRLGLGTAGQVLTVNSGANAPEWATPSSSGMTLIQRSTFSNVAGTSTTFDGVFSSTYVSYLIEVENLFAATTGNDLQFVFRISAVDAAAHYGNQIFISASGTTFSSVASSNAAQLVIYSEPTTTDNPAVGQIFVSNIGTTKIPSMNGSLLSNSDNRSLAIIFGVNNLASTYTGFRLKSASSNITGTVAVYGLAK